jgi:hypothetical protein
MHHPTTDADRSPDILRLIWTYRRPLKVGAWGLVALDLTNVQRLNRPAAWLQAQMGRIIQKSKDLEHHVPYLNILEITRILEYTRISKTRVYVLYINII